MGKTNRKIAKKQQKLKETDTNQKIEQLKKQMRALENEAKYERAIEILAELIDLKCYEPDVIFAGARDYFMIGDYARAAKWVDNTLHFAPQHIDARILLTRLCLLEDRVDDSLAIFAFIFKNYADRLSDAQKGEAEEILAYYGKHMPEKLRESYPEVYDFLQKRGMIGDIPSEASAAIAEEPAANSTVSTLDSLKALKERIQGMQEKEKISEKPARSEGLTDHVMEASAAVSHKAAETAEGIRQQVLQKDISFVEKIRLLNAFAGGFYIQKDYTAAELLLRAALEQDRHDDSTLRNMAMLQAVSGQPEKALDYAGQISQTDFLLLQMLQQKE